MSQPRPHFRSHYIPRTRDGWIATISFLAIFMLAMPPFVFRVLNRADPWILGMPFLYVTLFAVYVALILVLFWTYRRGV